jgi:hypothetical protein
MKNDSSEQQQQKQGEVFRFGLFKRTKNASSSSWNVILWMSLFMVVLQLSTSLQVTTKYMTNFSETSSPQSVTSVNIINATATATAIQFASRTTIAPFNDGKQERRPLPTNDTVVEYNQAVAAIASSDTETLSFPNANFTVTANTNHSATIKSQLLLSETSTTMPKWMKGTNCLFPSAHQSPSCSFLTFLLVSILSRLFCVASTVSATAGPAGTRY